MEDGTVYAVVKTSNVPSYTVIATQDIVNRLSSRPKASTDFSGGATSASVGDTIVFGEDIGISVTRQPRRTV